MKTKPKLKVLLLNNEFPPLGGGAGNATYYLLKEFSLREELEVDLITSSPTSSFAKEKIEPNITIHKLPVGKKNIHYWTEKEMLCYCWKTYGYLKNRSAPPRYDLIHAFFSIPSGLIAYLCKKQIPYLVSLRGSDVPGFNERFSFQYIFLKPIIRQVWKNASAVIANSQGLKELALRTASDLKIDIIPNGVNIADFTPRKGRKNGKFTILTVARLIPRKGIDNLIKAVPLLVKEAPNIRLRIIGEGNKENELKRLAQELKVAKYIDFWGYVPHQEIANHYSASDIFVLPSRNEGMSNVILEAMASGLPIITTDTGGTKELIKGNGIIVPRDNSEAISNAVLNLIRDKTLRENLGIKGRKIAESMSWKNVAQNYFAVYKKSSQGGHCENK